MKKTFTLVEIIIVVLIIMILLLLMLSLGWNYIKNIQLRNDKEDFIMTFTKTYSKSLTSSYFKDNKYEKFQLSFYKDKNYIDYVAISGDNKQNLGRKNFLIGQLSGDFMTGNFIFKSYQIGCEFDNGTLHLTGGNVRLDLFSKQFNAKHCFSVNLNACKLKQIKCN